MTDPFTVEEKLLAIVRKELLEKLLKSEQLNDSNLYYASTYEISEMLYELIQQGRVLTTSQREKFAGLSAHDLQVILSHHLEF